MPDRTAIQSLILESVQMLAEDFELEALKAPNPQTALYGVDGSLDSMALVNLIADIEEAWRKVRCLSLADEKAMSAKILLTGMSIA